MATQPQYITRPEFEEAFTAFSGYVDHSINMVKMELRKEIIASENRIIAKITELTSPTSQEIEPNEASAKLVTKTDLDAAINGAKEELKAEIQDIRQQQEDIRERQDRIEGVSKANHQMLQLMLDQFSKVNEQLSKINKRLGID